MMEIIESFLTNHACYKAGKKLKLKGLMIHSVGTPQPSAQKFVEAWNKPTYTRKVCINAFIDANTGDVYQTLPWDMVAWHAGKTETNNTYIGVEMCEPPCIKYTHGSTFECTNVAKAQEMVKRTTASAVELFAMLCKRYGLDPLKDGVIISHREGAKRGIASNHGDPDHLWKQLKLGYNMDTFRQDVYNAMHREDPDPPKPDPDPHEYPPTPFKVKVLIDNMDYRKTPDPDGIIRGQTKKGTFTIVAMTGDWGKLKSGAGWIDLSDQSSYIIKR